LTRSSQRGNPIRVRPDAILHHVIRKTQSSKVGAYSQGPLAPRCTKTDEVLHVTAIVEEFFGTQPLDDLADDRRTVALLEQFPAQIIGCVIAPGQAIERRYSGGTRIERVYFWARQGFTPL
jgi:hypothetical protein